MPSNHLILCHPLPLLSSIFHSIRVFSDELTLCIRWPKDWSFSTISVISEEQSIAPRPLLYMSYTLAHAHTRTCARTHTHTHTQHTHAPTYLPLSPYQAPCPWAFARLFPPPDTLIQPSIFLPLIKCYSFLRAHCKCCFFQDVFPDPSQGGHISPYLSHSSTIFGFTKQAFYHRYLCQELSLAPS